MFLCIGNKFVDCLPRGVTLIPKTVKHIPTDHNGVEKLIFTDDTEITADLLKLEEESDGLFQKIIEK